MRYQIEAITNHGKTLVLGDFNSIRESMDVMYNKFINNLDTIHEGKQFDHMMIIDTDNDWVIIRFNCGVASI